MAYKRYTENGIVWKEYRKGVFVPFKPGESGNAGRKKTDDTPRWALMATWFAVLQRDMVTLTPLQRVDLAKWALEYLVENAKALPAKKSTNDQAADLLKSLEQTSRAGSSAPTVEDAPGQGTAKKDRTNWYTGKPREGGEPGTPNIGVPS